MEIGDGRRPGNSQLELQRFVCVDVDRTVLKSTTLFTRYIVPALRGLIEEKTVKDDEQTRQFQIIDTLIRDMAENVGRSFDFLAAYNDRINENYRLSAEELAARVLENISTNGKISEQAVYDILAESTLELLVAINELSDSSWGFFTSGGVQTQSVKLIILEHILKQYAGLPLRAQIISTEHKTRDVDTVWRRSDGLFEVPEALAGRPGVVAKRVVVVDDKKKNLISENSSNITTILVEQLDMPDDGADRMPLRAVLQRLNNIDK